MARHSVRSRPGLPCLSAGTRVAHFEVAKAIGAGAMGEVYRARDLALGRAVALKVLPDDVAGDPVRLARFEREARAAAALNHPNILVVFEVGVTDPVPYVAAELLDGRTLAEAMRQPLGIKRAADYAAQVARGLAAAHEKGVIHRDIKPANLFVTTDGVVKILDFGIAKVTGDQVSTATMTLEGTVIGTAPYMAPEQVRGAAVDGRTDLFALGAVCYEMLAGRRAFLGDSTAEILSAVLQQDPPDLHTLVPAVPPGLARVVHRCLEKDPVARFQSARDLAFALETAMQPDGTVAPSGFGRRGLAALAAVLVAGLVVGGIIGGRLNRDGAEPTFARHLSVGPPAATPLSPDIYVPFALSPDGTTLVFADRQDQRLFVRRLDTFAISPYQVPRPPTTPSSRPTADGSGSGATARSRKCRWPAARQWLCVRRSTCSAPAGATTAPSCSPRGSGRGCPSCRARAALRAP